MGAVGRRLADCAVVTSDNPRSEDPDAIIAEIVPGPSGPAELRGRGRPAGRDRLGDRRGARGTWSSSPGKGHEQGQERDGVVTPFDDRDVARSALAGATA